MGRTKEAYAVLRARRMNREEVRLAVKGWAFLPHEGRAKALSKGRAKLSSLLYLQPGEAEILKEQILDPIEKSLETV
jgi:hypothetical protein